MRWYRRAIIVVAGTVLAWYAVILFVVVACYVWHVGDILQIEALVDSVSQVSFEIVERPLHIVLRAPDQIPELHDFIPCSRTPGTIEARGLRCFCIESSTQRLRSIKRCQGAGAARSRELRLE